MRLLTLTLVSVVACFASCEDLARLDLPFTSIATAELITSGSLTPSGETRAITGLPAFCRVAGAIRPTSDSDIRFEVWMPASGWNGKFQGVGNGGFAGSISYGTVGLAGPLKRGYATAATDTGHSAGGTDASWALGHREKLVDYGYRAIHLMTERAKSIVEAFYGKRPARSYFASCSNGGRQALMEAQRYPADYDGIIAGAPANDFTGLLAAFVWNSQALSKAPIPAAKLKAIEVAAVRECDERDGTRDGLLDNPGDCRFSPSAVQCDDGADSEQCLTRPEAETLRRIYSGPKTSKGTAVYPGFPPGGETGPAGWSLWITGQGSNPSLQFAFSTQYLRHMLFEDPAYDYLTFSMDTDLPEAEKKLGPILNATSPDLTAFQRRGGKLILFHGWSDAAIPAQSTIDYFQRVRASMGTGAADNLLKLYLAPGMQHCAGGPGPSSFGAVGEAGAQMFTALEHWVENDTAPGPVIASKPGTSITRPLCPYPQVARFNGNGSPDDAANFVCSAPR